MSLPIDLPVDARWIGGSACAGKSAVAARLAAAHGCRVYHCDERFDAHLERARPARHGRFLRLARRSPEEMWMQPVDAQVAELVGFYREALELVGEDLGAGAGDGLVLVEGAGLLPAQVAERVPDPRRAIWLVSTPAFRRRHYPERGPEVLGLLAECRDPEEAYRRWMARDDAFAERIVEEARGAGRRVLAVDGRRPLGDVAAEVARHFGLEPPRPP